MPESLHPAAQFLWWIPFLPLLGSVAAGILHFAALRARRVDENADGPARAAGLLACLVVAASFILSVKGFLDLLALEPHHRLLESTAWSWIDAGSLKIDVAMVLDPLSSVMTLVVTGVGLLIHVYALGYMKGDPGFAKFFSYLNLFVFAMLILVLSSSLLGLFVGWEGVGLCSYLLIGFWYTQQWPSEAAQKAFVTNRVGDACFLVGSFLLVGVFSTLDLSAVNEGVLAQIDAGRGATLALAALLLFGGACGKSAQMPLFVWLPDAMAGPTPVSALIHAATMVTAGVYLVVRLNPLFAASAGVLATIGIIAAVTAFLAGSAALAQRDIKKVLAYSTISQLGYMFLGLSAGAWSAAIFHLVTHAFFKALLFLGAGSVIHGMHDQQDMLKMGGLRHHMPRTFITFLAGAGALSGLPLLSGFFSKDEILAHAFAAGGLHTVLWIVGVLTAAITAFYTFRMVALTFFGRERFDPHEVHPHESPPVMTVPLVVLAVLSVVGGVLGLPAVFHVTNLMHHWLEPVSETGTALLAGHHGGALPELGHGTEWLLLALGAAIALIFAHRGFHAYADGPAADEALARRNPALWARLSAAWGIDEGYRSWIIQPLKLFAFLVAVVVDQFAIDGVVNGVGHLARTLGDRLKRLTDGSIASWGMWMGAGAAILAILWIW